MILLAAATICSAAYAGPVMDNDIAKAPKKVEKAFQKMYPGAKDVEWELKRDIYAVDFRIDGKDVEAYFNAEGTWLRSKEDVNASSVPAAVKKAVKEEGITQEEAIVVKANKLACYLRNHNKNLTKKQEEYFEELWIIMTDWEYVKKNLAYYHLDGVREKK